MFYAFLNKLNLSGSIVMRYSVSFCSKVSSPKLLDISMKSAFHHTETTIAFNIFPQILITSNNKTCCLLWCYVM